MKKRIVLSVVLGIISIAFFAVAIYSSVRAYKARNRMWYVKNVNPYVRVEVINATGIPGLARKVTFLLRQDGFDVVYYSSSKDTIKRTVIVERSDSTMSHAKHLAKWIGCKEITLEWDYDKISDCAIVIGLDFNKYFPGLDTAEILY